MKLLLGILHGFGTIGLCILSINFGRADKWWAWAVAALPLAGIIWWVGGATLGSIPALSFVAITALACGARRRWHWMARI